jgi:Zn-dependent protease with chaperone function
MRQVFTDLTPVTSTRYTMLLGYAMGLAKYASDPVLMDEQLLNGVIGANVRLGKDESPCLPESSAGDSRNLLTKVCTINSIYFTVEHKRVDRIAKRVLAAARMFAEKKVMSLHDLRTGRVLSTNDELKIINDKHEIVEVCSLAEELYLWAESSRKLEGEWRVVVIRDEEPNAFVTEVCPKRIFVNIGLIKAINPSDDELAMIIAHELSHLMLGHGSSALKASLASLMIQLVFISFVDPFGVLSFFLDFFSFQMTKLLTAYKSRQLETEADTLGLELSAMACFDVELGSHIFRKLGEVVPVDSQAVPWYDSHPPSKQRFEALNAASARFSGLHNSKECQRWRKDFRRAVGALNLNPLHSFRPFWTRHTSQRS